MDPAGENPKASYKLLFYKYIFRYFEILDTGLQLKPVSNSEFLRHR